MKTYKYKGYDIKRDSSNNFWIISKNEQDLCLLPVSLDNVKLFINYGGIKKFERSK